MSFVSALARKKYIDQNAVGETQLARCLSTLDLTALGRTLSNNSTFRQNYYQSLFEILQVLGRLLGSVFTWSLVKSLVKWPVRPSQSPSSSQRLHHSSLVTSLSANRTHTR